MKKRVFKTRISTCALLLAVVVLAGSVSLPAFAREEIAIGQSGDPNDGEDIFAGGGGTPQGQEQGSNNVEADHVRHVPILIPVVVSGTLLFFIIVIREPTKVGS